jgi:hypothetical protein
MVHRDFAAAVSTDRMPGGGWTVRSGDESQKAQPTSPLADAAESASSRYGAEMDLSKDARPAVGGTESVMRAFTSTPESKPVSSPPTHLPDRTAEAEPTLHPKSVEGNADGRRTATVPHLAGKQTDTGENATDRADRPAPKPFAGQAAQAATEEKRAARNGDNTGRFAPSGDAEHNGAGAPAPHSRPAIPAYSGTNQGQNDRGAVLQGAVSAEATAGGETTHFEGPNSPDAVTGHHSPAAGKGETAAQQPSAQTGKAGAELPEFFPKLVDRAAMTLRAGQSEMRMVLKPEVLGQVRMQVLTQNQHVMVKIIAETHAVKEVIETNLGQLKSDLQSHGLEVDAFDVTTSQDSHREGHNPRQLPQYRAGARGQDQTQERAADGDTAPQADRGLGAKTPGRVDYFA